jgi:hypothetical protein
MTNYQEDVIREYIRLFQDEFANTNGEAQYEKSSKEMNEAKLENISEHEVKYTIQPFLYKWGKMQRAAFKKRAGDWQTKLAKQIQSNFKQLEGFRTRDLRDTVLGEFEPGIKHCYESFYEVLGKVGAAKVLHVICPSFFPAWDNPIADAILEEDIEFEMRGRVVKIPADLQRDYQKFMNLMQDPVKKQKFIKKCQRERKRELKKSPSAEYYRFMQATQNFIKRYETILSELAIKYQKGVLKISDECFWWAATYRPLCLFFEVERQGD